MNVFPKKYVNVYQVAAVSLLLLLLQDSLAIPVCYQTQSYYIAEGYTLARTCQTYTSYRCGIRVRWRRIRWGYCTRSKYYNCDTIAYNKKLVTRLVASCCSQFTGSYPNCEPICNPQCVNGRCAFNETTGNNYCTCNAGWTGETCDTDINECLAGTKLCHDLAECVNTAGSYKCQCQSGYEFDTDGFTCVDANECTDGSNTCLDDIYCHNTVGNYYCACPSGYLKDATDPHKCHDIDECTSGNGGCQQICVNTNGSYHCICQTGYSLNTDNSSCSDINECIEGTHNCSIASNNFCVNTIGSFRCQCNQGYESESPQEACTDIDECSIENGACSQICNNTVGSYFCSCSAGYQLLGTQICQDIDECLSDHGCQQVCDNLAGSYKCNCVLGYILNDDLVSCKLQECSPRLITPLHGNLSCPNGQVTNTSCDTSCDLGYELTGPAERTCQPNGSWTSPPARCTPMKCPTLEQPENGYIRSPCPETYGSTCSLQCVYGFEVANGSTSFDCELTANKTNVQWTEYGTCQRRPVCDDDTCVHGKCIEVSQSEFHCDCTGTLYTGKTCNRGLILVPDVGELRSGKSFDLQITTAVPNETLKLALRKPCAFGGGGLFLRPCEVEFGPSSTTATSTITGGIPGIYYLNFNVEGPSATDFEEPPPVVVIVKSGRNPYYFTKLTSPYVYNSCCELEESQIPLLKCGLNPRNSIQFTSSCSWESFGFNRWKTSGITFSSYNDLSLPVSVAGIEMSKTDSSVSLSIPATKFFRRCGDCNKVLKKLSNINRDERCYEYMPITEDLSEFASKQSLTKTFLAEAQLKLLPNWLRLIVPDDSNALKKLVEADYRVSIGSETEVLQLVGCESLLLDRTGQFSVLLHNGPLDIDLKISTQNTEQQSLSAPNKGSFYCIAVDLCSGDASPLYLAVPHSIQGDIVRISFLNKFIGKGWSFTMNSFIFWENPVKIDDVPIFHYWNGLTHNYLLPMQESDVKIKMASTGLFSYGETNVSFSFDGNISYKYTLKRSDADDILTFGEYSLKMTTKLHGKHESLSLQNVSSSAFIHFKDPVTFSCSTGSIPSGISFKLSYRVESTDGFFFNFFQLPYDTPHCPVDMFINLNSLQDMNGLSFYSNCLELVYDSLVLAMLSHKFYIPMDSNTLCIDPRDFTNYFSSPSSFGLWVQSSLFPSHLSYYQLNPLFKLQPGKGRVTVSLGFSGSADEKVGLLHSVEIAVLDGIFESPIILRGKELSFTGSTVIFNNDLYFAQLKGTSPTTTSWAQMMISINGWFPRGDDRFLVRLEESVRQHLRSIANRARMRLGTANDEVSAASDGVLTAATALGDAQSQFTTAEQEYEQRLSNKNNIESELVEAEEVLQNATGELKMAEEAIADLCEIKTCTRMCVSTSRPQIVVEDVYKNETVRCPSFCCRRSYRSVPVYFLWRYGWRWQWRCYRRTRRCGFFGLCIFRWCRPVCAPYWYWYIFWINVPYTYNVPCEKPCTRRVFVRRIKKTVMVTDPCGSTVPDATCARTNELCQKQRDSAFGLIDEKRQDLTNPLRQRNSLKRQISVAENNLLKSSLAKDRARDKVLRAETQVDEAEERRNATLRLQQTIRESDDIGYRASELLQSSDIANVFSITNISFTVMHSSASTPLNFPISIEYSSGGINHVISRQYYFKTSYKSQKDSLVEAITVDMLEKRSGQPVTGRRRRAEDNVPIDGEKEFQARCIQLRSLLDFLTNLHKTLIAANTTRTKMLNEVQKTLRQAYNFNSSLNTANISVNYTRLQNTFNISTDDIERASSENTTSDNGELDSYIEILNDLISDAEELSASIEPDAITEWRRDTASSLEKDFTLGNSVCYGLKDCILVFTAELQNMLDFAPASISRNIQSLVPKAAEMFMMISSNATNTFRETFAYLEPMMNITDAMNKTGYWCAQPPTVTVLPPILVNVSVSEALTLSCLGNSFLPLTYQWRKDGIILKGANQSTFTLPNMQVFDEGNYTCDITNTVGTVNTTNASVLTYQIPRFYLVPISIVTYSGDENGALFTCNATSRPDPGWKWFHKSNLNDEWKEIEGEITNELLIPEPTNKDIGWYMCMALNYHGNISSDPVYLRIVKVTTKVDSLPISFVIEKNNNGSNLIGKRQTEDIRTSVLRYLYEKAGISSSDVKDLNILTDDGGNTYQISFYLLSRNITSNNTSDELLATVAERLQVTSEELMRKKDDLKSTIDKKEPVATGSGSRYSPSSSSFTVQHTNILCPPGQKLHSSSFLCIDCLEGERQVSNRLVREVEGAIIVEMVPVCRACPENTYQDRPGGRACHPCPANHITASTGAKSRNDCIALCLPHTYSSNGLSPCNQCPEGQYQPQYGSTSCVRCLSVDDNPVCAPNPCALIKSPGNCSDSQTRVYYDTTQEQCLTFQYTGCGGNTNNFKNFVECSSTCGCPSNMNLEQCQPDPCLTSSCPNFPHSQCLPDYCGGCKARFYQYGKEVTDICSCPRTQSLLSCPSNCTPTCGMPSPTHCITPVTCSPSCGCPVGTVLDEITNQCIPSTSCDTCSLSLSVGPCKGNYPRWFFNSTAQECQLFSYGGCEGNSNRFTSLVACIDKCGCPQNKSLPVRCSVDPCQGSECPAYPNSKCEVDKCSTGNCTARHYSLFDDITSQCDICALPVNTGSCNGNVTRWYFNKKEGKCQQFIYSGCDANGNNFETLSECLCSCVSCPIGISSLSCDTDSCDTAQCTNHPEAYCVTDNCGLCTYRFYNSTGDDVTNECDNCPPGEASVSCTANPCDYTNCYNHPEADCTIDTCGQCSAMFSVNGTDVTESCGTTCSYEGQVFKQCKSSCQQTCATIISKESVICTPFCNPGCDCPAGQVLDEEVGMCVSPDECLCPDCEPLPENCSNIIVSSSNDSCSCPTCGDCAISGQFYKESNSCPKTCSEPYHVCPSDTSGCTCPSGQLIDEEKQTCVEPKDCPKINPCTMQPYKGPCNGQIQRYFYNSTSEKCEVFYYGGCHSNKNNFFTKHDCEEKCSACPPTCSREYCVTKRGAVCTIDDKSISSNVKCPRGCLISNCWACYYSYTALPYPVQAFSCPANCPLDAEGQLESKCMQNWGRCVLIAYTNIYKEVLTHERTSDTFKCWSYPC